MKRWALISGASSGIGREIARRHCAEGGNLLLVARRTEKLEELRRELSETSGAEIRLFSKDLSRPEAAEEIFRTVITEGIEVDYLINNAGFGGFGPFHESDWDREAQMIDLNVRSLTHMTKLFLPAMVARGSGKVMNVASTAAFQPGPLMAVYYATKAYVLSFSEALANEVAGTGVTVTALCPGPTASEFQAEADIEESKLVRGRRLPTSAEVADYGYRAMLAGKPVAIHGVMNRLMAASVRFTPRSMVTAMVRRMQEKG